LAPDGGFHVCGPRTIACSVIALLLTTPPVASQQDSPARRGDPPLETVLELSAGYVTRYMDAMSSLTAEERYVQDVLGLTIVPPGIAIQPPVTTRPPEPIKPPVPEVIGAERRVLRADLVLVSVGPPLGWRMYRDVFEVDGRPVRDRAERLAALFQQPAETARAQAERIADASARFNISNLGRVLNEPGLPLAFLQTSIQSRFHFALDRRDRGNVWTVRYTEQAHPTLFWHNRTIENPSSGRFWIDVVTGEVSRSEHVVSQGLAATFVTQFHRDDRFGISVPTEMREQLSAGAQAGARRVAGVATYSRYRKFSVTAN
jgi:hypothetical protein